MGALPSQIRSRAFDYEKAVQAAGYLAYKSPAKEIERLKALKLLYLADKYHLRKYGRPITWDKYCALPHGPIASQTMDIMELDKDNLTEEGISYAKQYIDLSPKDSNSYISIAEPNWDKFSRSDVEALDAVFDEFGKLSGKELEQLTHDFHPEWKESRDREAYFNNPEIYYVDFFGDVSHGAGALFTAQTREQVELAEEQFKENIGTMSVLYG